MESAEKVRLVKCPKCQNVLPELPNYYVYQCGGCGAVLHAKGEFQDGKCVPVSCDDESNGAVIKTVEGCPVMSAAHSGDGVAVQDIEPGVGSLNLDRRSSEESIRDVVPGVGETEDRRGKGVAGVDVKNPNINMPGILLDGEGGGFRFRAGCESELQKTEPVSGWRRSGAGYLVGSVKDRFGGSHGGRFSIFKYPEEAPSNCNFTANYDSPEALLSGKRHTLDGGTGVRLLERDRAELLRKLDELKIQLLQSHDIGIAAQEGTPLNGGTARGDAFGNSNAHSPVLSSMSHEQFDAYRHSAGLPYFGQYPNSRPLANGQNPVHNPDASFQCPRFVDHQVTQMHRSCPGPYDRVLPHGLISGQYLDPSCDPFGPVPTASIPHQSTHACFTCNNDHGEASASVPPSTFWRNHPNVSPSKGLHYPEHPSRCRSHCIGPKYAAAPFISNLRHSHLRQPGKLNSDGFTHNMAQRMASFDGSRRSRPVVGGAPFLTCSCCLELLQLPRRFPLKATKKGKIRCGACFALISYDLTHRKIMFTARTEDGKATAPDEDSSCEVIKGSYVQPQDYITAAFYGFSSDDNDNVGQDALSSERRRVSSTGCNNPSLTNLQETESISPGISDQDNSPTGLDNSGDSMQRATNIDKRSPLPDGSPLQEHSDHTSRDHSANRFGKGNRSSRSDHEKVLSNKAISRQNSLQETTLATEMEMPFDELSDNVVSRDSEDANGEHDRSKRNKGDSFLSNIFKKSFKDLSRSGLGEEHGKGRKVYINGHLIPDRSTKKAEKLAGPIQAGKYWYDFRAGFWGVMGGPCLGIIPPYIQEFNYPMKESCAGGDTGVFVNGRELHSKDLDLLATRGLPIDRDRSYIIEITGRVYDEDTGEELDCLGKLAPTVEKAKHGFGMKAPKAASD